MRIHRVHSRADVAEKFSLAHPVIDIERVAIRAWEVAAELVGGRRRADLEAALGEVLGVGYVDQAHGPPFSGYDVVRVGTFADQLVLVCLL